MSEYTIAVVTWNRSQQLRRCLESIQKLNTPAHEVVIVDNASTDDTNMVISDFVKTSEIQKIIVIKMHKNIGCPMARNIAFANTTCEFVYALDDDGWLECSAIDESVELLNNDEDLVVVCSAIVDPESLQINGRRSRNNAYIGVFSAGASLYRTKYLQDGHFFPDYRRQMEESYFSYEAYLLNKKIMYCGSSTMFHDKSDRAKVSFDEMKLNYLNEICNIKALVKFPDSAIIFVGKSLSHFKVYVMNMYGFRFIIDFCLAAAVYLKTKNVRRSSVKDYSEFVKFSRKS